MLGEVLMVSSLPLHNWKELERAPVRPGVEPFGFRGEGVMYVLNWLNPGMQVFPHGHTFEQLDSTSIVDDRKSPWGPGSGAFVQ
jgi:hypothetical protein